MYLGYQNNTIALVADTREKIENAPLMSFTKIEETKMPVELINGAYYLGQENIDNAKKDIVRNYRNHLLEVYIDPVVSNFLRWIEIPEEDKQVYQDYRRYLLDYTEQEGWWNQNPLTFEKWKASTNTGDK